jgi:uncharacterized protein (TIGR02145 family)
MAGGKMKETGASHWLSPNTGASNSSGFTALPGGERFLTGGFGGIGNYGIWWASTYHNSIEYGEWGWFRDLIYNSTDVSRNNYRSELGNSVRCLRD